jgi:tRNA(fMet)-specific endonuclease VapC
LTQITYPFWESPPDLEPSLLERIDASGQDVATTIITVEEQLRGWLAEIHRLQNPHRQIVAYERLQRRIEFFAAWTILPWDANAADILVRHRTGGVRIGSLDLKIACIVIAHDATLLTRNSTDFSQVPGLRFESWIGDPDRL